MKMNRWTPWTACREILWMVVILFSFFWSGCALVDAVAGIHRDKDGKVVSVDNEPIGGTLAGILSVFFPWGGWAATSATAAIREYRHWQIVSSGGKDDDNDGKPDPAPPPLSTTAGPIPPDGSERQSSG